MNKRILFSFGVIAFVAALSMTATGAFFSDSETSTGNTFTAGAIDLKVDSTQHYNGNVCTLLTTEASTTLSVEGYYWVGQSSFPAPGSPCTGTWLETDLGAQQFWNFNDVKPGDEGENTISLHVDSNDAYACADVTITKNDENVALNPEILAGDVADLPSLFDGELAQNINVFAWADDGDNVWESGEPPLFTNNLGPVSDALTSKTYTLADSNTGPLPGGTTRYIGLAWCAGTMTAANNVITCNGAGMGNIAQTDTMQANVAFRVEQARNNASFKCVAPGTDE